MAFSWSPEHLAKIRDYPHLIGHMVGKDKLTDLHSDWIKMIWDTPGGEHASLMSHRGAYKTTAITECGIIYYLLFHPNDRIALVRENFGSRLDPRDGQKIHGESRGQIFVHLRSWRERTGRGPLSFRFGHVQLQEDDNQRGQH